jgi:hypothetical protein
MEVKIYCIEDCDGLKYVGSTKQKLKYRLTNHKYDKKNTPYCTSSQLNLEDCSITQLELCNEENRKEREKYWINKLNCINKYKLNGRDNYKKYQKEYRENNKQKNKDKYIEKIVKNCLDDLITKINFLEI